MHNQISKNELGLLIVDVQEKLYTVMDKQKEFLNTILKLVKCLCLFKIPILISEQYPKGLDTTIQPLKEALQDFYQPWEKTSFSCMGNPAFASHIQNLAITTWIVAGLETHICILQTVKDLKKMGKNVIIPCDAVMSKSVFNHVNALEEMRTESIRVSTMETIVFELAKDAAIPEFKMISQIIKNSD